MRDLLSIAEIQPLELLIPVTNPLSLIALCTLEGYTAHKQLPAQAWQDRGSWPHPLQAHGFDVLAARWAYYHHTTQHLPQGAGPKRSTPVTSTWPVHKAMGDEGFVTESIVCVLKVHEIIGPMFELGHWSFFLVLPSSWGMESHSNSYKTTPAPNHLPTWWTTCSNNQHLAAMCCVFFGVWLERSDCCGVCSTVWPPSSAETDVQEVWLQCGRENKCGLSLY